MGAAGLIEWEVIVVGGGPAGSAVAAELARRGVRTLIIDCGSRTTWPGESLPPGASRIIEPIFGPDPLANPRHRVAYGNRSAWGSDELIATDFMFNPFGHGWHVDRAFFDADLLVRATELGATCEKDVRVARVERTKQSWQVFLSDSRSYSTLYVVDATGRSAGIARSQGSKRIYLERQVAVIGTFPDGEGEHVTAVESVQDGWWYTTPLASGQRVIAYLSDGDLMEATAPHVWSSLLRKTKHLSHMVGSDLPSTLVSSAAETSYLSSLSGPGWLAVGDAATAWDPLSSQGVTTAILMGGKAGLAISELLRGNEEPSMTWTGEYRQLLREHCEERSHLAQREKRWPDSVYWQRRHRQPELKHF